MYPQRRSRIVNPYVVCDGMGSLGQSISSSPSPDSFYQVVQGDTLSSIASRAYGEAKRWRWIFGSAWNKTNYFTKYGKTENELHKVGDPKAYPVLWIPPAEGIEPSVGPGTRTVTEQIPGPQGPRGEQGPMGPPPSAAEIQKAVDAYIKANPIAGKVDPATIEAAVTKYMQEHPVQSGEVSPEMIANAVKDYLAKNPPKRGKRGKKGVKGDPGRPPTIEEIESAVTKYMKAHPASGKIDPATIEAAVTKYMQEHPVRTGEVSPEMIEKAIQEYMSSHPIDIPAVDPADIKREINEYFDEHPVESLPGKVGPRGEQGLPGQPGARGEPGPPPSLDQIRQVVTEYMQQHPASGKIDDASIEAAVASYMQKHPVSSAEVSPEMIQNAVNEWMASHPVQVPQASQSSGLETVGPLLMIAWGMMS